jgi:capsid protein
MTAIRAGLSWRSEELRKNGVDPDEWLAGMIEDNKALDDNGIVLDSDPRTTTLRGAQQKDTSKPASGSGQ